MTWKPVFTVCGNGASKTVLIYFHGLDEPTHSPLETMNEKTISELSHTCDTQILSVRSKWIRSSGQLHWPRSTNNDRSEIVTGIHSLISDLFVPRNEYSIGALGFWNGGFFLTRLWLEGQANLFDFVIGCGCGIDDVPLDSYARPPLMILIGDKDQYHFELATNSSNSLISSEIPHGFKVFPGGHILPLADLKDCLNKLT